MYAAKIYKVIDPMHILGWFVDLDLFLKCLWGVLALSCLRVGH